MVFLLFEQQSGTIGVSALFKKYEIGVEKITARVF